MAQRMNRRWILKSRPQGMVEPANFELTETPVAGLSDGQILAQTLYLSFDPTQRAWMAMDTYMPAVELGETMRAGGMAQVIESKHAKFKAGDLINYLCGWQEYVIIEPDARTLVPATKIPGHLDPALILALSLTGLTAYFGLFEIGQPRRGETVLVSGAAGATGSVVGQIAKLKGCRVIGIAGGAEKCAWLTRTAKFDAAIDYKNENVGERVAELCPQGVDIYFDNVGGPMLDEILLHLAMNARVVICGAISQYNDPENPYPLKNYLSLLLNRATARGFIVFGLPRACDGGLVVSAQVGRGRQDHPGDRRAAWVRADPRDPTAVIHRRESRETSTQGSRPTPCDPCQRRRKSGV